MAMTAAERQAKYRHRALKAADGLMLTRVQTMLDMDATIRIKRLMKKTGWTQRECIERGIELLAMEHDCMMF